jgi:hypothetical protein
VTTTTPPDQRQRRRLVFRHVSAHPTRSDAFQFYGAVSSIAWQRETVAVLSDGREIEQRPDGLHVLTLTFSYGPVIGGHLTDGKRIIDRARKVKQPVEEEPLTIIERESEPVAA